MPSSLSAADLQKLKGLNNQLTTIVNHASASAIGEAKNARRRRRTSTTTKAKKPRRKRTTKKH